jgi:predicted DNA-binding transcriptional regulator AlpA
MDTKLDDNGLASPTTRRRYRAALVAGSTLPAQLARARLVSEMEAAALVSLSRSSWRRLWQAGRAPAPVRLSPNRMAWRLGAVLDWADERPVVDAEAPRPRRADDARKHEGRRAQPSRAGPVGREAVAASDRRRAVSVAT